MYDGVLRLPMPSGTTVVGFADDVAVVVTAKERTDAEDLANEAIGTIEAWLTSAGLELAAHKTEAVLISSRKAVETAEIRVGGTVIRSQRAIKYLGVLIDTRLSFREHLEYTQKASETAGSLTRILLNTRGPKQITRKLLTRVVTSQILYAAPVWAKAAATKSYMRGVEATYRLCAVRVTSAFRTVSDDAILVIAGMFPLRELIREKAEIRCALRSHEGPGGGATAEAKSVARGMSYESWQAKWDASSKGRWTHRLIPNLVAWMQVLSGHGCFRSYLKRFGHDDEDGCPECGPGVAEDVHHIVFECRRFDDERAALEEVAGAEIRVDTLVPLMMETPRMWEATATFSAKVLMALRVQERGRRERTG
ncbi:hypothetical protein KR200_000661 [Drosophila serrata]|nr:hypothetical protein KR200_000661 [Drosophila serrata]